MYIAWFYPPGREKMHALGALDLALWDIKGKALKLPVHELLGGSARDYCECYATGGAPAPAGAKLSIGERARATMEAGYRAFRMGAADVPIGGVFDTRTAIRRIAQDCKDVREGVGPDGDWCIDLHQRFDFDDALRACKLMEEYEPFFVEDPVRDEHALQDIPKLRQMTTVPLTHGEEWGLRWDFNRLVENHDIDFIRSTLPNVGGITEMMKVAAICETHAVGIVPHFTGPIATAGLVNCLSTFSGPVHDGVQLRRPADRLPAGVPGLQERQGVHEPAPGPRRDRGDEAADADRRGDGAGPPQRVQAAGRLADALVSEPKSQAPSFQIPTTFPTAEPSERRPGLGVRLGLWKLGVLRSTDA